MVTPVFAAIAAVLSLGVLAWVLWPLWRRIGVPLAGSVLALTLVTFALYQWVGTPEALHPVETENPQNLDEAITRLQAELERNPNQPEGWALLGRSHATLGRLLEAREAYARAVQLAPDEPALLVDAAESRALADPQRRFDAQAVQWLQHALARQPGHPRATWFLGVWHRQSGRPADAAATWETLIGSVDDATARSLRTQIDEARADAGQAPLAAAPAPPESPAGATATDAASHALQVRVSLAPDVAARLQLSADATVFVIARAPGGPPMPVAAERHRLRDLPLDTVLDDADAAMPTLKLSQLDEVEVLARISAGGGAERSADDLESTPVRVRLPASGPLELVIGAER
ncbi:tetratricopeptide repeat protein [Xanthomonas sp. XNM01]|uniref:tetratricopeptide repeat protein n=1 Tax=Xanthomonas sp. XNM01 TaxID=2769289 RepID=UPI00178696A9|nr:tetratricopeptide repeat protein [Xanthomonas sp. XNM01]MBD9369094.1 tetratricopeptide repeat protein [Xanthomonas sp. XNM01]